MKKNYKVGDVVWVKMRGSPWWPASIQLPKTTAWRGSKVHLRTG